MLSLSCKAAIKAVIFLGASAGTGEKYGIKEISLRIDENEHTVGKLLQKLVREKIIKSNKGPNGGSFLTPKQSTQRILTIVEAIDGQEVFRQCGLGLSKCSETRPCPIHEDYKPVRDQFKQLCYNKRISDLYSGVNEGIAYLVG